VAQKFGLLYHGKKLCIIFEKMGWATFWAIFSQTKLSTSWVRSPARGQFNKMKRSLKIAINAGEQWPCVLGLCLPNH
jgi:hypothetical protein